MKFVVVPERVVRMLALATTTILCIGEARRSADPIPAQDHFALFERPLLELAGPDPQATLLDLERTVCDLARLDLEEDCEHLLRVAGALRWQAASSGLIASFGYVDPPSGIQELEELAWIAYGLRARGRAKDGDLVSWAVRASVMDLVGREDPESHWIRGQTPSDTELLRLSLGAEDAARTPLAVAAMSAFQMSAQRRATRR